MKKWLLVLMVALGVVVLGVAVAGAKNAAPAAGPAVAAGGDQVAAPVCKMVKRCAKYTDKKFCVAWQTTKVCVKWQGPGKKKCVLFKPVKRCAKYGVKKVCVQFKMVKVCK